MSIGYSETVETARRYYNSDDADNFYFLVWGGEDIHIGLYETSEDPVADASHRTVARMADSASGVGPESRVLDIGAGYGGAARYLAKRFGCRVTALNLSEKENERDRQMNAEQGIDHLIDVVDGSFEAIPAEDASFDLVWSQDAILHSGEREKVIAEVARVLRPGGELIFTDPMQADDCPAGVLGPVLDRIHLASLGSVGFYREMAAKYGLAEVEVIDLTENLPAHYQRVREELERLRPELEGKVSDTYVTNMIKGLKAWVDAGNNGYLNWSILHFRKPAS
ncbi:methylase involved in ubiquinone/menaquinone biosynthesis [Thioflavicoccus mobilis 8321]|uniref:Methylase involved in ubiquinone/menaquinone biosynthesis n=1 Tax=Thioflavicoccus mobilis 8321 TaxID=765912 RepID=L0GZ35_9GAMM|nr:methyltransferase domain-containing protein [Thioflavicoccus mobilis]AGA90569.1 methylase involved in ubiquinone/menaquinone biosynthesis [Thioflavicoccus mobilis 8321]